MYAVFIRFSRPSFNRSNSKSKRCSKKARKAMHRKKAGLIRRANNAFPIFRIKVFAVADNSREYHVFFYSPVETNTLSGKTSVTYLRA